MKNKLDTITKFTLTFGITGAVLTCIGIGANIAGATAFISPYFKKTPTLEACIKKVFYAGNILIGSGLFTVGASIAVAKHAGENLRDPEHESDFKGFSEGEKRYLKLTSGCTDCKYFHGQCYGDEDIDFICGIHPYGNTDCSDFEPKSLAESVEELNIIEPDYDLTEDSELRAQYKHYYEFVKDAEWVSDDLGHYLGRHEE